MKHCFGLIFKLNVLMILLIIFSVLDFVFFPEGESVYMYVQGICVYMYNTKEKLDLADV